MITFILLKIGWLNITEEVIRKIGSNGDIRSLSYIVKKKHCMFRFYAVQELCRFMKQKKVINLLMDTLNDPISLVSLEAAYCLRNQDDFIDKAEIEDIILVREKQLKENQVIGDSVFYKSTFENRTRPSERLMSNLHSQKNGLGNY